MMDRIGKIEGQYLPVATPLEISRVECQPEYCDIWGGFKKLRGCNWIGRYRLEVGGRQVAISFLRQYGSRDTGRQYMGPWRIYAPDLEGMIFTVWHECHGHLLWRTKTDMTPLTLPGK